MPKYQVYALATASAYLGEFEADTKEGAEEMAWEGGELPSLCHQCAGEVYLGDWYEAVVEEV